MRAGRILECQSQYVPIRSKIRAFGGFNEKIFVVDMMSGKGAWDGVEFTKGDGRFAEEELRIQ